MAIFEELGISATILIDGKPAKEYDNHKEDPKYREGNADAAFQSKYIEVVDAAAFKLCFTMRRSKKKFPWLWKDGKHCVTFVAAVDGQITQEETLVSGEQGRKLVWRGYTAGLKDHPEGEGIVVLKDFKFQAVTLVEDTDRERVAKDKVRSETMGVINVSVFRSVRTGEEGLRESTSRVTEPNFSVAEKALNGRAISHATGFGDSHVLPTDDSRTAILEYPDHLPFAVFIFRFRSRKALMQECIIPRDPEPTYINGIEFIDLTQED